MAPSAVPRLLRRGERVLSPATVSRLVARRVLVPVLPGVHLRHDVADEPLWRAAAVAAWCPDAVLLGSVAAHLTFWPERPVDCIRVARRTSMRREGYSFERRVVPPDLVVVRGGIRLSAPALTALDLAGETDGGSIDALLRSRLGRIDDLRDALLATPHRRGNRDRRRLLLESRAEPWSAAERLAHRLLRAARIRGWWANRRVVVGGRAYFLDIAFPGARLAIEIDGREFHATPEVFEGDRRRQNALVLAGWTVLRFTWRRLTEDPEGVLAEIRAALRAC